MSDSPVREGEVLAGKYRIERVLGVGGMGVVVAAVHLQLDQHVALKFLLPEALKNPDVVARFAREARAAAKIQSEHVARVIDVGTLETGSPYMVMEYLQGRDLAKVLEEKKGLPFEEAVGYVMQACEAIAEAHAAGIVHRDLKPANLFLAERADKRAIIKVLDFGISKSPVGQGEDASLTRTSTIMGSPLYMSPEQMVAAKSVDARCDVWALGVILYELVTGGPPFIADSMTEIIALVLQAQPQAAPLAAVAPPELRGAILRCLEKDPARRFQNVGELATALAPFAARAQRQTAERVSRVLGTPVHPVVSYRPQDAAPSTPLIVAASTNAGWDQTRTGSEEGASGAKPNRVAWTLAAGAGVAAVLAAATFVALRRPAAREPDPGVAAGAATALPASAVGLALPAALAAVGLTPSAAPGVLEPPRAAPIAPEAVAAEAPSTAGGAAHGPPPPAAPAAAHPPHSVQAAATPHVVAGAPAAHSPAPSPASPQSVPAAAAPAKNPLQIDLK